jgi:hypothetical protein
MNNAPQPTQPVDPDMALLFSALGSEKLLHAPERDDATLDAVAAHIILDERPKTLLGLVITALAEKWLRRRLWMVDFDRPALGSGPPCASSLAFCLSTHRGRASLSVMSDK